MPSICTASKLTEKQTEQVHELEQVCSKFDRTEGSISLAQELNFYREMNCFYLLYEEELLIGLVSVFAPVKDEAEISALILPQHRRKGFFNMLLRKALIELGSYGVNELYFVHDRGNDAGKGMIDNWGITPDHSEYLLVYDRDFEWRQKENHLHIKQTGQEDLADMTKLSLAVFGGKEEEWTRLHKRSLESEKILCYTAYDQDDEVGISSVNMTQQGLFIFGFGISASCRRRGYGRRFLYKIVEELQSRYDDDILLEVDSNNYSAYMLYTTSGFEKRVQFDYYKSMLGDIYKDERL